MKNMRSAVGMIMVKEEEETDENIAGLSEKPTHFSTQCCLLKEVPNEKLVQIQKNWTRNHEKWMVLSQNVEILPGIQKGNCILQQSFINGKINTTKTQ